jgi:predicted patatin/cPLA2 family phospholipase
MVVEERPTKRALVISGGASKGAYAGGIAEYLLKELNKSYQIFVGTSAGSLLIPFLALGATERLKDVFTSIRQRDIFNVCPFIIKKKVGGYTFRINHFNTLRMFLRGKKTFGESENLRRLIRRTFTQEDYRRLRDSEKEVIVTVSNLSCFQVEYKSLHDCSYTEFCDWMWISANIVPFMSLVRKDGMEYADGGFGNYLPLREAYRRGATEVDAIILKTATPHSSCRLPARNAFHLLIRSFDFMLAQISLNDLDWGQLAGGHHNIRLNCYHTSRRLTENSLIFDPAQMALWWQEGYRHAQEVGPECRRAGTPV